MTSAKDAIRAAWVPRQIAQLDPKTGSIGTAVMMAREYQAARAQPERVAMSDDELRIEYASDHPHGIRDKGGFLFFFPRICKYDGQETRYKEEIEQQNRLANFLLKSLVDRAILASQAELVAHPCKSNTVDSQNNHIVDANEMVAQPEMQNFCGRCGKRNFAGHIHTCTPPLTQADHIPDLSKMVAALTEIKHSTYLRHATSVAEAALSAQSEATRDDVAGDARDGALNQLREWFAEQRKAISKGCGSTWDMGQCDEQLYLIDAAIAAGKESQ